MLLGELLLDEELAVLEGRDLCLEVDDSRGGVKVGVDGGILLRGHVLLLDHPE